MAFTHGAFLDHRMFDKQVPVVAAAGYRVLCWDVRGHGPSQPIGEGFSVGAVADDLTILDLLGYEKAVLVGQSFGGYVAQAVAFRRPELAQALVLIGSAFVTGTFSGPERLGIKLSSLAFRLWPYGDLKKRIADSAATKPQVREYAREAAGRLSKDEFFRVDIFGATVDRGARPSPAAPDAPRPRRSRPHRRRGGGLPRSGRETDRRYEEILDAGHSANQDNPTFFNKVLLEFLREHAPA